MNIQTLKDAMLEGIVGGGKAKGYCNNPHHLC